MIQANEVRVGNYVCDDYGNPHKWDIFDFGNNQVHYSPIPLTPEILLACGFSHEEKESRSNESGVFHVYQKVDFTFNSNHGWWFNGKQLDFQPQYLHQLQNLYYALTQEELTYKPMKKI